MKRVTLSFSNEQDMLNNVPIHCGWDEDELSGIDQYLQHECPQIWEFILSVPQCAVGATVTHVKRVILLILTHHVLS